MKDEKMTTIDRSEETVAEIISNMRLGTKIIGYWSSCDLNEILQYSADRLEAAYNRENHCEKRYDRDGNEMPPHCAFDDLKVDRLQAKVDDLKAELERIRTGNAAMREALKSLLSAIYDFHENAIKHVGQDMLRVMAGPINRAQYALCEDVSS